MPRKEVKQFFTEVRCFVTDIGRPERGGFFLYKKEEGRVRRRGPGAALQIYD